MKFPQAKNHVWRRMLSGIAVLAAITFSQPLIFNVAQAQQQGQSEGGDLWFGGQGSEAGKFVILRDMVFDAQNNLYTLDGAQIEGAEKTRVGNLRVQKFSPDGKLLSSFPIRDEDLGVEANSPQNNPQRVAVDALGHVYVTQPDAGKVQQFAADGKLIKNHALPNARVIALWRGAGGDKIVVGAGRRNRVNNVTILEGGDKLQIIQPPNAAGGEATLGQPIALDQALTGEFGDIASDKAGNLFVLAGTNQIWKYGPDGKRLKIYGAGTNTRNEDGSELLHTVTVDSVGNVYGVTFGNPGKITRFDADGKMVTQREGQWKWADPWSVHSNYIVLQTDNDDRLWVGVPTRHDPKHVHYATYHASPAVLRTKADYFAPAYAVRQSPVALLGFKGSIKSTLTYNIAYTPGTVPLEFVVAPSNRQVQRVEVAWHVHDWQGRELEKGRIPLPLKDGEEVRTAFSFRAPRYGAYFVACDVFNGTDRLISYGEHIGVTPRWPKILALAPGEAVGGWNDAPRQMFTGLPNFRLHLGDNLDVLDKDIALGEKYGATTVVQLFDNQKKFNADAVRKFMERFKGRVKYVEVCNEPNFSGSIEEYFNIHKQAYDIIKGIDPAVQIMGPATVNIDLNWLRRLYGLGFKNVSDAISIHDYEGHESITPEHWRWKFGEMRKIMAANGDANKPIWQNERAISGVRGDNYQGTTQAIRTTLHRDLLETLGVPTERNNHYYLNQGGYSSVPTYVWSNNGPHAAALALRTRHALTTALGRKYKETLNFGPTGNKLFLGVRYAGADGETLVLRNLGSEELPLVLDASGAALDVVDAWGNTSKILVAGGKAKLMIGQLPTYVRLSRGQTATPQSWDFGRNLAVRASFAYTGGSRSDNALLNNGILETYHSGNPNGDTNGAKIWQGDLNGQASNFAIMLGQPRAINKAIFYSVRGDNTFSTLLDYDLQYHDGKIWKTLETVRTAIPPSIPAHTADATHAIWYRDDNLHVHQFPTITTDRLRLVVRRATHGFIPDDKARAWTNLIPQKLMLREVELYAPALPVGLTTKVAQPLKTATFNSDTATVEIANRSTKPLNGTVNVSAPQGWRVSPAQLPVKLAAGARQNLTFTVTPPQTLSADSAFIDVALKDAAGQTLDSNWVRFDIVSPVVITPQSPGARAGIAQPLSSNIKNTTLAPLSGTARLELTGPTKMEVLEQPFGPIAANAEALVTWNVPNLQLAGARWTARYTVTANQLVDVANQDLAVRQWSVVGPFPREFDTEFGPEKGVDLAKVYVDMMGQEKKWFTATSTAEGLLNLEPIIKPNNDVSAYAVVYVTVPSARKAIWSAGADDGGKGWLNGQVIMREDTSHGAQPGQFKAPVELKAGRNEVLFKITQGNGGWGFYFDLIDPASGLPFTDLAYSPTP
jgi:hypothetical protein